MFTIVEVTKNQYPYSTLHVVGCSALRGRGSMLSVDELARYDIIRTDFCKRCLPRDRDAVHPAVAYIYRVQREYKDRLNADSKLFRLARQVVALELATAKVDEAVREARVGLDPRFIDAVAEYRDSMANGTYTPDELDVTVGRATITSRPPRSW